MPESQSKQTQQVVYKAITQPGTVPFLYVQEPLQRSQQLNKQNNNYRTSQQYQQQQYYSGSEAEFEEESYDATEDSEEIEDVFDSDEELTENSVNLSSVPSSSHTVPSPAAPSTVTDNALNDTDSFAGRVLDFVKGIGSQVIPGQDSGTDQQTLTQRRKTQSHPNSKSEPTQPKPKAERVNQLSTNKPSQPTNSEVTDIFNSQEKNEKSNLPKYSNGMPKFKSKSKSQLKQNQSQQLQQGQNQNSELDTITESNDQSHNDNVTSESANGRSLNSSEAVTIQPPTSSVVSTADPSIRTTNIGGGPNVNNDTDDQGNVYQRQTNIRKNTKLNIINNSSNNDTNSFRESESQTFESQNQSTNIPLAKAKVRAKGQAKAKQIIYRRKLDSDLFNLLPESESNGPKNQIPYNQQSTSDSDTGSDLHDSDMDDILTNGNLNNFSKRYGITAGGQGSYGNNYNNYNNINESSQDTKVITPQKLMIACVMTIGAAIAVIAVIAALGGCSSKVEKKGGKSKKSKSSVTKKSSGSGGSGGGSGGWGPGDGNYTKKGSKKKSKKGKGKGKSSRLDNAKKSAELKAQKTVHLMGKIDRGELDKSMFETDEFGNIVLTNTDWDNLEQAGVFQNMKDANGGTLHDKVLNAFNKDDFCCHSDDTITRDKATHSLCKCGACCALCFFGACCGCCLCCGILGPQSFCMKQLRGAMIEICGERCDPYAEWDKAGGDEQIQYTRMGKYLIILLSCLYWCTVWGSISLLLSMELKSMGLAKAHLPSSKDWMSVFDQIFCHCGGKITLESFMKAIPQDLFHPGTAKALVPELNPENTEAARGEGLAYNLATKGPELLLGTFTKVLDYAGVSPGELMKRFMR